MDPISHGLLGASTTQALYQTRYPQYRLWIFGLLAAMAPDLDILIRRAHDPLFSIFYHRHFSHALLFIPIGASIIAGISLLLWPRYRTIAWAVWVTCMIGYASHGLLDCLTSYGTLWYWPFQYKRVAWDIISIVDPRVTLILLIGVIGSCILVSSRIARITLIITGLFFSFATYQHNRASMALIELANKKSWNVEAYRVMPALASLSRYNSVLRTREKKIQIATIKLYGFKDYRIDQGPEFQLFSQTDLPKKIAKNASFLKDFTIFNWFSDGYIAASSVDPLVLMDLRYGARINSSYRSLWAIEFPQDASLQHVIWHSNSAAVKSTEITG